MTAIDQLLARARLHPQPDVPDDSAPYEDTPTPPTTPTLHTPPTAAPVTRPPPAT